MLTFKQLIAEKIVKDKTLGYANIKDAPKSKAPRKKKEKPFRDAAVTGNPRDFANEEILHEWKVGDKVEHGMISKGGVVVKAGSRIAHVKDNHDGQIYKFITNSLKPHIKANKEKTLHEAIVKGAFH